MSVYLLIVETAASCFVKPCGSIRALYSAEVRLSEEP